MKVTNVKHMKWIVPTVVIIVIGWVAIYGYVAKNVPVEDLTNLQLSEKDGYLHVTGDFKNASDRYAGYNYTIVDGKMYLSIKAAKFTGKKGGYNFKIHENHARELKEVTLRGTNEKDQRVVPIKR